MFKIVLFNQLTYSIIESQMNFSLLFYTYILLIIQINSSLYITDQNVTIVFELNQTISFSTSITGSSSCGKIVTGQNYLYHHNKAQQFQVRQLLSISNITSSFSDSIIPTLDYNINQNQTKLIIVKETIFFNYWKNYALASGITSYSSTSSGTSTFPTNVFMNGELLYVFYKKTSGNDTIVIKNLTNSISSSHTLPHYNCNLTFSPDFAYAVAWDKFTRIYIYNASVFTLLSIVNDSVIGRSYATQKISFSADNSSFIVEADQYTSVKVISLINFTVINFISINTTISGALFVSDEFALIISPLTTTLWQFNSNFSIQLQSQGMKIDADTYDMNLANYCLVTCYNNVISKYRIGPPFLFDTSSNLNSTSNSTNNTNSSYSTANSSTNSSNVDNGTANQTFNSSNTQSNDTYLNETDPQTNSQTSYSKSINLTQTQKQIYDTLGIAVQESGTIILQKIVIIATSTPLTFYFLSFLNFLNFSCLYVILNISIPQPTFNYLSSIFSSINSDFLKIIGFHQNVQLVSCQMVDNQRALHFGISSDVLATNYLTFFIILFNICISQLLNFIGSNLKQTNFMRKFILQNRVQVFSGQIIASIITLTLPWKYVLFGGIAHLLDKYNLICQYFLFFLALVFSICYILILMSNKNKINSLNYKINKKHTHKLINRRNILNVLIIERWYICLSNFAYSFLVILSNPIYFFIIIFLYCAIGIWIAFKRTTWKLNSIILSFYPLIFHSCFIIFYLFQDDQILAYTGIVCLCVLLLGAFHNLLTLIILTFSHFVKTTCPKIINNKVHADSGLVTHWEQKIFQLEPQNTTKMDQPIIFFQLHQLIKKKQKAHVSKRQSKSSVMHNKIKMDKQSRLENSPKLIVHKRRRAFCKQDFTII